MSILPETAARAAHRLGLAHREAPRPPIPPVPPQGTLPCALCWWLTPPKDADQQGEEDEDGNHDGRAALSRTGRAGRPVTGEWPDEVAVSFFVFDGGHADRLVAADVLW